MDVLLQFAAPENKAMTASDIFIPGGTGERRKKFYRNLEERGLSVMKRLLIRVTLTAGILAAFTLLWTAYRSGNREHCRLESNQRSLLTDFSSTAFGYCW